MGKQNTDETLAPARERAKASGVPKIVLASTTGYAARKALGVFAEDDGTDTKGRLIGRAWDASPRSKANLGRKE